MSDFTVALLSPQEGSVIDYFRERASDLNPIWVDGNLSPEEQARRLRDVDAVVVYFARLSIEVARECPRLKLVQATSAGTNHLPMAGLARLGIKVANNGGANAIPVAEHTIALMLLTLRRMVDQVLNVRQGRWNRGLDFWSYPELTGKTVGIIGFGHIGQEVARRLIGFRTRTLFYDIREIPDSIAQELHASPSSLTSLLSSSDIVSLHVPLSNSTFHLISERQLSLMKPSAILINTCRGPVVDESALLNALSNGTIAGAGLDVFEQEPTPPDNPLLQLPNVVATPHWAGGTRASMERAVRFAVENVLRIARGEEPQAVIHPE